MNREELLKVLQAGDLLAYNSKGLFSWLVKVKTWHSISHVEVYIGDNKSVSSRFESGGVKVYDLRVDGLEGIYRPIYPFDLQSAMDWFWKEANGQKYDWKGILGFISLVKNGDRTKMFCSEFCARFYKNCGLDPFSPHEDADKIAPFQLVISNVFRKVI